MPKRLFNAMDFGTTLPGDAGISGCEKLQCVNRGFYGKNSSGKEVPEALPLAADVDATLNKIDKTKPVYFDFEPWLCNAQGQINILTQKLYAGTVLRQYAAKGPTGTTMLYGFPGQDFNPLNPPDTITAWKSLAASVLNGGELSSLIMANINALGFSAYPSEYTGKDDPMGSFPTQVKFNQISLDTLRANNPRNLPIYGWFKPAMVYRADGKHHMLDYKTTIAHMSWLLENCDGVVLWYWGGYPDVEKNLPTTIFDPNAPWYQAIKDSWSVYNSAPVFSQTVNRFISKFPSNFASA